MLHFFVSLEVWYPVLFALIDWIEAYPSLNIMMGSVLDANRDGLRDPDSTYPRFKEGVVLPSHMFVVVTRCGRHGVDVQKCPTEDLLVLGMFFQHPLETGVSWRHERDDEGRGRGGCVRELKGKE